MSLKRIRSLIITCLYATLEPLRSVVDHWVGLVHRHDCPFNFKQRHKNTIHLALIMEGKFSKTSYLNPLLVLPECAFEIF